MRILIWFKVHIFQAKMRKPAILGLYALTIVACFIAGTLFTQSLLPAYAKKPGTGSYEIELQYLDGTLITSYEWGAFTDGEEKEIECRLVYLGDMIAKVTWNAMNLPEGLDIEVWDQSHNHPKLWDEGDTITFKRGKSQDLRILLRSVNAESGQHLNFVLRFISTTPN